MKDKAENQPTEELSYIRKALKLAADYFLYSDERLSAWFLLIGSILAVIALVALTASVSWWSVGFWAALMAKDLALLLTSMLILGGIILGFVSVNSIKNYLSGALSIQWRNWLTLKFVNNYTTGDTNFLDLARVSDEIENPEQRIQEDVESFVDNTISLGLDLLNSTLSLGTFVGTLWIIGGTLSFIAFGALITIPGYLVWIAIAVALVTALITYLIGNSLSEVNNKEKNLEADLRQELQILNNGAESVAQEQAQMYYQSSLTAKMKEIYDNAYDKLGIKTRLNAFKDFCAEIPTWLPYLASAPLYFIGQIEFAQLMQIGFSFGVVSSSLGWFVNSYETLTEYDTSINRIYELEQALEGKLKSSKKAMNITQVDSDELVLSQINIALPTSPEIIMRNLNLKFTHGQHTVIKAESGIGKSTLFKILGNNWEYGEGSALIPNNQDAYFLPQQPEIPHRSLRTVLAYPDTDETKYTDEQYIAALHAVNMAKFSDHLDESKRWNFSLGEKQRISFARALLRKPKWLFLDEATASLDLENEENLYQLIQTQLPDTTFISIVHRPNLDKFHNRIVTFKKPTDEGESIEVSEELLDNSYADVSRCQI